MWVKKLEANFGTDGQHNDRDSNGAWSQSVLISFGDAFYIGNDGLIN
jgi:hypothetical protein